MLTPPDQAGNGILLGQCENSSSFKIPLTELAHVAFYGQTFLGKTYHAMYLAKQLDHAGITLTVVDRAGTWRRLIPNLRGEASYFDALKNLQINPFGLGDPGLVEMLLKETIFKGIEYEYADISPQMNFVLNQCIRKSKSIPDLLTNIGEYESPAGFRLRNLDATKTALFVRLEPYKTNSVLAKIFYCQKSNIDLSSLGNSSENTFVDLYSLHKLVAYKKEVMLTYNFLALAYLRNALFRKERANVEQTFIIDEAQLLVPKIFKKVTSADTWATTDFAAELLKRGVILCIITHFPTAIEEGIIKNIHHNFIYRLQDADEIRLIAGLFGYTRHEQISYIGAVLTNLKQRWSLVRTSLWKDPFLVKSPDLHLDASVDLEGDMPGVSATTESVTHEEQVFLSSIESDPFVPASRRRKDLGFDKRRYAEVVAALTQKGVIEKVHVRQRVGRPIVLYQRKGARPSVEHEYYVHWLKRRLESNGFRVKKRDNRDLVVEGVKTVVIEYETGTSDFLQNIRAGLAIGDFVISTSVDDAVLNRIRTLLEKEEIDTQKVKVTKVWEVLDHVASCLEKRTNRRG